MITHPVADQGDLWWIAKEGQCLLAGAGVFMSGETALGNERFEPCLGVCGSICIHLSKI